MCAGECRFGKAAMKLSLLLLAPNAVFVAAFQSTITHRTLAFQHTTPLFLDQNNSPFFADPSDNSASKRNEDSSSSNNVDFGQSVPYIPLTQSQSALTLEKNNIITDETELLQRNRTRNIIVAITSFAVSIMHYIWQLTHPLTAVEILATMQSQSAPLTSIGNGKPTVVDFWAPWCENCKVAAPTLQSVEEEYSDRVNFIMVNGDDGRNWPLIQLFGVDAIPHLALLSDEGDVETALIGPMSRNVLRADIDALLNPKDCSDNVEEKPIEIVIPESKAKLCHDALPYTMYDAFGNRERRINFSE